MSDLTYYLWRPIFIGLCFLGVAALFVGAVWLLIWLVTQFMVVAVVGGVLGAVLVVWMIGCVVMAIGDGL